MFCFELYAAVMEMAGGHFPATLDGMHDYLRSVDRFGKEFGSALERLHLSALPVDFDTLNTAESYKGTDAPLRPTAYVGHQQPYYHAHPELDSVTERGMISTHLSMGYRDAAMLKRMIRVLTVLGPGLAAAFSSAASTVLLENKKRRELFDAAQAADMKGKKTSVLVPRIMAWAIGAPTRSGLPKNVLKTAFNPGNTFADFVQALCDFEAIILTPHKRLQTFNNVAKDMDVGIDDYLRHVKTLWLSYRTDLRRLESREAGSGIWKSKALACLLVPALMDPDTLSRLERYIDQSGLTAKDIHKARKHAAFHGLDARMGSRTVREVTHDMMSIVRNGLPDDLRRQLSLLKIVLQSGSDAEIIARHPEALGLLMSTPFAERQPLAVTFKPNSIAKKAFPPMAAAHGIQPLPDNPSFARL